MAKVYITEFRGNAHAWKAAEVISAPQASDDDPVVEQTPITSGGASAQSAAFNGATRMIRIHTDGIISIAIGSNPTASTNTMRLAANQTEYFGVKPGEKVAVITNT